MLTSDVEPRSDYAHLVHKSLKLQGIRAGAYVPDNIVAPLLERLDDDPEFNLVRVVREEEGVGVVGGHHLGGVRSALILQSSGIGNSLNAIGSFVLPYQVPLLMIVSPRGGVGEINPAQIAFGRALEPIFTAMGMFVLPVDHTEDIEWSIAEASRTAFRASCAVAVLLNRRLTGGKDE